MPHLIEFYDRETGTVVPRLQDGSAPRFLFRIMSRAEWDKGVSSHVFRSRDGRLHASITPLFHHCEPGDGNVLTRISFIPSDGWRAKQTLDGVVAIADSVPATAVTKIAEGNRNQIEAQMARIRIESKAGLNLKLEPKGRETGRNFQDGKYVLYQFGIVLEGKEIAELSAKFTGGDKDEAKVNIFGSAQRMLGTSGMRQLFGLLKKRFPKLVHIYGERISGARAKSGKTNKMAHFTIAETVKSDEPTALSRLSRFFSVMSKPNDDLQRVQQGRILWARLSTQFVRFMKNKAYRKAVRERDFAMDAGTGISYQRVRSNPFNPPYAKMGDDAFFFSMEKLLGHQSHRWSNLTVVLNLVKEARLHGSGVFYGSGIWGVPTIVVNAHLAPDPQTYEFDPNELKQFVERFEKQGSLAKVFTHEFSHYLDFLTAQEKTPAIIKDGKVVRPGGNRSKYVSPDVLKDETGKPFTQPQLNSRYRQYVNNHQEINSRYMEFVDAIILSFDRLISVKRDGVKGRFPTFHSFWEYYWKEAGYAPDALRDNASPKTERRIARRLSKFYDYVTESGARPAPLELKRFALKQLDADPKFVERDDSYDMLATVTVQRSGYPFVADFSNIAEASLHDAFGPMVGVGTRPDEFSRNRDFENQVFAPKAPKPAKEDATKVVTRQPPGPNSKKGPPPTDDEAADEPDEVENEDADAPARPAPKKGSRPRPRMQLRANYRKIQ